MDDENFQDDGDEDRRPVNVNWRGDGTGGALAAALDQPSAADGRCTTW